MDAAEVRSVKVSRIFNAFDVNSDGGLSKAELLTFVARVNPTVKFTPVQLIAIADEVCLEYAGHVGKAGLTEEGLRAMYESGNGNVDDDYEALGFTDDDISPRQATEAATVTKETHATAPEKEYVDLNEPDQAEAEPSTRASWAGKLGKWAAALKPTAAAAPPSKEAVATQNEALLASDAAAAVSTSKVQQGRNDKGADWGKLGVPKLDLGKAAGAASDAWLIKAHSQCAAAAASEVEVRRATVDVSNAHVGQGPTKTAEESIAAAKRELASYKQVKHEAAIRAVTAAKRALDRGAHTSAEADGAEAAMAGALDAVADAKRALSSHPLPDAAQPIGAVESVAAAQKALAVVPTEYDDDGPVPPLRDTLAAIRAAREALGRYPEAADPGSPLPAELSPGPKSHRIHIAASPSHHSYAPAVARKLDTDAAADHASHGYVPSSVDGPKLEFEGTATHGYVPSSEAAPKVGPDAPAAEGAAHGYVPAVPARDAAQSSATATGHSYVPRARPSSGNALRKSLSKLAHRFVPGLADKEASAQQPSLSDHAFLPEATAKDVKSLDVGAIKAEEQPQQQEATTEASTPAGTPTKTQEELSKWFNHTWDPNCGPNNRQKAPIEGTTSNAETFVDAKEEMQTADSFTSAQSQATTPRRQQPLLHALSERISCSPNGILSCLNQTPPRTPRAATPDPSTATGEKKPAAAAATATPRREAKKAAAAAQAAAQRSEIEEALAVPAGATDSLQLVLESVQRVILLEGNPEWTAQQLAKLRDRANGLESEHAHSAQIATAGLLASMERHEEAIPFFEAALGHQLSNAKTWFRLGVSFYKLNHIGDAESAYLRAIQEVVLPKDARLLPKIHLNLGIAQEQDGRLLAACDSYREVVLLNADHYRAFKLLGSALYALGDLTGAERALRDSLAIQPSYSDALCDLGCVLCALRRPDEAKEAFKNAICAHEHHIEAHFNLGNVYRQCGQLEAAEHCYSMVLEAAPGHWRALLNLSVALAGMGRSSEAHRTLRASFKASGSNARVAIEIKKLLAMSRKGKHRNELMALMEAASETATVAIAVKPDRAEPSSKKMWAELPKRSVSGLPKRGLSGLLRRAPSAAMAQTAEALQASLDEGLLKQLSPLAAVHPYRLEAQVTEDGFLAAASPGGTELAPQGRMQGAAVAEGALRALLPETAQHRFQHLMRIVLNEFIVPLNPDAGGRETDVGVVLALLAAVADGDMFERADAAHALLRWRSGQRGGVPQSSIALYVAGLKAVYGREHDMSELRRVLKMGDWGQLVQLKGFQEQLKAGFPAFEMLRSIAASN
ncbi:g10732 [Coccomyxa elongata]